MPRNIIATVLVAALVLTSIGATPAAARDRNREAAQVLAGVAALFVLGKIIEDNRDRKKKKAQQVSRKKHYYEAPRPAPRQKRKYQPRKKTAPIHPRPLPRDLRLRLPNRCEVTARTRHGWTSGYRASCLRQNFAGYRNLPDRCRRDARFNGRVGTIYSSACLRDRGYKVSRR